MKDLIDEFGRQFSKKCLHIVKSPYRICPLGAHVDHQSGLVTGFTINKSIDLAFSINVSGYVQIKSADFPDEEIFHIDHVPSMVPGYWGNYLRGAVLSLQRKYKIKYGIDGLVHGELPIFGGLSSSAAVLTAYLVALANVNGLNLSKQELIEHGNWVENRFIGLNNGILDQAANVLSVSECLMFLDCQSNKYELIKKPESIDFEIAIVHSGISKALISTDYNNRVDECKAAAWLLQEISGSPMKSFRSTCLRHIDKGTFDTYYDKLPGRFQKRAKHFFSECERVQRGAEAWEKGNIFEFGKLMNESCVSSIENYECGCPELITIFDILRNCEGVYGARFSGAGYRGCCVAIINPAFKKTIKQVIDEEYPKYHPKFADSYRLVFCKMDNGVRLYESNNFSGRVRNEVVSTDFENSEALA